MLVVLITIFSFGITLGFVQGYLDPENYKSNFMKVINFTREIYLSEKIGVFVGSTLGVTLELLR